MSTVELVGRFDHATTTSGNILDNAAAGRLDIGSGLALHGQEAGEGFGEIGAGGIEW